ncbi:F-box protein [Legionella waltersii]|uniref:F-box domain-containing protein n=1 Tax=Legionella waltersii TaxID=66969 RepID=A0A0W1A227_9GAMM|nr:F-box protein [Legionella waltersii]KTD75289.1 hypothetical protein Lwal_3330 [Legionella waltersii]SNV06946.1 Uncharacterised protein [Legionella waltersii]
MPNDNGSDPINKTKETDPNTPLKIRTTLPMSNCQSEVHTTQIQVEDQNDDSTLPADLNQLPTELKVIITSMLPQDQLKLLLLVNKEWRTIVREEAARYLNQCIAEIKSLHINEDLDRISQFLNAFSRLCGITGDRFILLNQIVQVAKSLEAPIAKYVYLQQELTQAINSLQAAYRPTIHFSVFVRPQNNTLHKLIQSIIPTASKNINIDPTKILLYSRLAPDHQVSRELEALIRLRKSPHAQNEDNNNSKYSSTPSP